MNAALTLYRFHDNGAGFFVNQCFYTVNVVHGSKTDVADARLKSLSVMRVARYGKRSHGSAVEGMLHGNDFVVGGTVF